MDILQQTLPDFFKTGLVATNYHLPLDVQRLIGGKGWSEHGDTNNSDEEGIYSRTVRLEYTPPMALPSLFPRHLHIDGTFRTLYDFNHLFELIKIGLPLYVASSFFLRHTMNALYTDLSVTTRKVEVHQPDKRKAGPSSSRGECSGRQRSITLGHIVSGIGRLGLSSDRAEWDV